MSTNETIWPRTNMKVLIERRHVELSFDTSFMKIQLEIKVQWPIEFQNFCIVITMLKIFSTGTGMFYDKSKEYSMLIPKIYNIPRLNSWLER